MASRQVRRGLVQIPGAWENPGRPLPARKKTDARPAFQTKVDAIPLNFMGKVRKIVRLYEPLSTLKSRLLKDCTQTMYQFRLAVASRCFIQPLTPSIQSAAELNVRGLQLDVRNELRASELSSTGRRDLLRVAHMIEWTPSREIQNTARYCSEIL